MNNYTYCRRVDDVTVYLYLQSKSEVVDLVHASAFQSHIPRPFIPTKEGKCVLTVYL